MFHLFVKFEPRGTLGLQLPGMIMSFCCLSISGLERLWGYSCRLLSGLLAVCQFLASKDSRALAVRYRLVFLSCQFQAWRDSRAPAVRYYVVSLLSVNCRPRGTLGSCCRGLSVLLACSFCSSFLFDWELDGWKDGRRRKDRAYN